MVFARIRVTAGVPFDGDYVVTHPYGTETFPNVTAGVGNRDIIFTEDVGLVPGDFTGALTSRVGPFLQHSDAAPGGAPAAPLILPFGGTGANTFEVAGSRTVPRRRRHPPLHHRQPLQHQLLRDLRPAARAR